MLRRGFRGFAGRLACSPTEHAPCLCRMRTPGAAGRDGVGSSAAAHLRTAAELTPVRTEFVRVVRGRSRVPAAVRRGAASCPRRWPTADRPVRVSGHVNESRSSSAGVPPGPHMPRQDHFLYWRRAFKIVFCWSPHWSARWSNGGCRVGQHVGHRVGHGVGQTAAQPTFDQR